MITNHNLELFKLVVVICCCYYLSFVHGIGLQAELISAEPYIALFPEFLSAEECDKIIEFTKTSVQYKGNGDDSVYFEQYPRLPQWLQEIERRIGAIAGSPPHPGEEAINIHHIKAHSAYTVDNTGDVASCIVNTEHGAMDKCRISARGVHHDKVQKEFSSVTVLVYLSDIEEGGGTVWPCITSYRNDTQVSDACRAAFEMNARWYDGDFAVRNGVYQKQPPSPELKKQLDQILIGAHYGCLAEAHQPSWIQRPAFKTKARKGTAAVFQHNLPDLLPDVQAWHGGCLPISGDKWTLQKFKELPEKYRDHQVAIISLDKEARNDVPPSSAKKPRRRKSGGEL